METVLKPFINRFAQPILLSFCIAWIFWNWEIVVGLIWYNSTTLPIYGYKNYKELINDNAIWQKNYLYPLFVAVAYPYLRFGLNYFNTQIGTAERNNILDVTSTGKVSTLKFIQLKESYDKRILELSDYLEEQTNMQLIVNSLKSDLDKLERALEKERSSLDLTRGQNSELERSLKSAQQQISSFEKQSDINFIMGNYDMEILDLNQEKKAILKTEVKIGKSDDGRSVLVDTKGNIISNLYNYTFNILTGTFIIKFENKIENNIFQYVLNENTFQALYDKSNGNFSGLIHPKSTENYMLKFTRLYIMNVSGFGKIA